MIKTRREFVALSAGATTWPCVANAQQTDRTRLVGVPMGGTADDPNGKARVQALVAGLQALGWSDGRNIQIRISWAGGSADSIRKNAREMVALSPDVIVAPGSAVMGPLLQETRIVPVVFAHVSDPVGAGYVESLARPGSVQRV